MGYTQRSPEERQKLLGEIKSMKKQGTSIKQACQTVGISHGTYNNWTKEKPKAKKMSKPKLLNLPDLPEMPSQGRILAFWLNPQDLPALARGLQ